MGRSPEGSGGSVPYPLFERVRKGSPAFAHSFFIHLRACRTLPAAHPNPPITSAKSANLPTTSTHNKGTSLFGPRIRRQEGAKPTTTDKHSFALPKATVLVNEASPKFAPDVITPCIPLWQADGYPGPTSKPARSIHTPCESLSYAICNPSGRFFQPQEPRFVMAQKNGKECETPCRDNVFNEDRT